MTEHHIDASLRLAMPEGNHSNTIAFGTVTIDGIIRFIVQIREIQGNPEKKMKIYMPRQLIQGEWVDLIDTELEFKQDIEEEVKRELKRLLLHDMAKILPEVEVEEVYIYDIEPKYSDTLTIVAQATIVILGVKMKGILIKKYKEQYIVNMPQYKTGDEYRDIIYVTNKDLQMQIREKVIERYLEIAK